MGMTEASYVLEKLTLAVNNQQLVRQIKTKKSEVVENISG